MDRFVGIAVLLAGSCTGFAAARGQTPAAQEDAGRLTRLIAQLGSEHFSEREAATRALDALGPAALASLQNACGNEDAEVRRRAQELAEAIGRRLETERLLTAKRYRLVYKDTPVTEALSDFHNKTGANILLDDHERAKLSGRKITLDTGEVTFWEAFDQLCRKAELTEPAEPIKVPATPQAYGTNLRRPLVVRRGAYQVHPAGSDGRLSLVDGKPQQLPTCLAGAVRIRALPSGTAAHQGPNAGKDLALGLDVTPEPQLQWHGVINVRIDKAVDDRGQSLCQASGFGGAAVQEDPDAQMLRLQLAAANGMATAVRQWPVLLKPGKEPAKVLKEVQGTVAAQVQTPLQPLMTVDNVLKAGGRTVKGPDGALKVIEVQRRANGQITLQVQLTTTQGLALGLGGLNARRRVVRAGGGIMLMDEASGSSSLALQDAKGKALQLVTNNVVSLAQNLNSITQEMQLTFQPQKEQGEAVQLVLNGTRTVVIDVPFTLKDVPLP